MLDTSDYKNPKLRRVALKGDISEDQIDAAEELLKEDKFDRKNVIIIGLLHLLLYDPPSNY